MLNINNRISNLFYPTLSCYCPSLCIRCAHSFKVEFNHHQGQHLIKKHQQVDTDLQYLPAEHRSVLLSDSHLAYMQYESKYFRNMSEKIHTSSKISQA